MNPSADVVTARTSVRNANGCRAKDAIASSASKSCTDSSTNRLSRPENVARLKILSGHGDRKVSELAHLILEIARVVPGKRHRWLKLARRYRSLLDQAVDLLGSEFFEDLLVRYGDFDSPLSGHPATKPDHGPVDRARLRLRQRPSLSGLLPGARKCSVRPLLPAHRPGSRLSRSVAD